MEVIYQELVSQKWKLERSCVKDQLAVSYCAKEG